jgi:antitoxin CcdA
MPTSQTNTEQRRPTNVTLRESLVIQARELKINISQACEAGLAAQVAAARRAKWLAENRDAFDDWNAIHEREGLPLARFRTF